MNDLLAPLFRRSPFRASLAFSKLIFVAGMVFTFFKLFLTPPIENSLKLLLLLFVHIENSLRLFL